MEEPRDDMPEITTGNGIDRDLAATTNDRLKKAVWEIRILNATMGSEVVQQLRKTVASEEETKKSLDNLTSTIKSLDEKNGRLQDKILLLTGATVFLALVQIVVAVWPRH